MENFSIIAKDMSGPYLDAELLLSTRSLDRISPLSYYIDTQKPNGFISIGEWELGVN